MFEYPRLLTPGTGCGQSQMQCGEMDSCEGETSSTFLLTLQRTGTPSVYQTCTIMHYNPPPSRLQENQPAISLHYTPKLKSYYIYE